MQDTQTRLHSYKSLGTDQFWSLMVPTIAGKMPTPLKGSVCHAHPGPCTSVRLTFCYSL